MGQAQKSDRRSSGGDISIIAGAGGRTGSAAQRSKSSRARSGAQKSKNSRTGSGVQRSRMDRDRAGQRRTDNGGLEDLELWDISGEDDNFHLMRLADREQIRGAQRHSRQRAHSERRSADRSYSDRRNTNPYSEQKNAGSPRPINSVKRRRARRRRLNLYRLFGFLVIGVCLILIYQTTGAVYRMVHKEKVDRGKGILDVMSDVNFGKSITPPEIVEDFLDLNDYSRPGTKLKKVKSVFVHYTANPGTSAAQNRSYFANLAETKERSASAHFIIGYEGELIQCIPLNEQAYAVATRNEDSISIECCYLDEDGKFTQETYDTLIHTLAWLCEEYRLSPDDILRHYDCGGKMCPLYYVEHEEAWEKLLADVEAYRETS